MYFWIGIFLFYAKLFLSASSNIREFSLKASDQNFSQDAKFFNENSLECRKNCFLGERLIYLISEFLTSVWGLNSGRVLERNAFTNSTRWVAIERCENLREKEREGEDKEW